MDMKAKIFGQKLHDKEYHDREAAYLVLVDGDLFALVKTCSGKLFLPGGKIENNESKEECIIRECKSSCEGLLCMWGEILLS